MHPVLLDKIRYVVIDAKLQEINPSMFRFLSGVLYVDSLTAADGPVPTYLDLLRVTSDTIAKGLADGLKKQAEKQ